MKQLLLILLLAAPAWADFDSTKAAFDSNMKTYGAQHCAYLKQHVYDDNHLNASYYDGQFVYYQIADYTSDPSWNSCAQASEWIYRDNYIKNAAGVIAGYWNFGRGLAEDYKRTNDALSLSALDTLRDVAPFCRANAWELGHIAENQYSREVSYCIVTYVEERKLGRAAPNLPAFITAAKGHVNQWLSHSDPLQPFFAALTAKALAQYIDDVQTDAAIVSLVANLARETWTKWDPAKKWFNYIGWNGTDNLTDLNLLIAPMYAWAYKKTGDSWFAARFDEIFASGVASATISSPKQFNQNYFWSIKGLAWRYPMVVPTPTPTATPTAAPTPIPTPTPCSMVNSLKNHDCRLKVLEGK